jgi:hypothetical protein
MTAISLQSPLASRGSLWRERLPGLDAGPSMQWRLVAVRMRRAGSARSATSAKIMGQSSFEHCCGRPSARAALTALRVRLPIRFDIHCRMDVVARQTALTTYHHPAGCQNSLARK